MKRTRKIYLLNKSPEVLEMERIVLLKLISCGWTGEAIANFMAAQRIHGVLRDSRPLYQVNIDQDFWRDAPNETIMKIYDNDHYALLWKSAVLKNECLYCESEHVVNPPDNCAFCRGKFGELFLNI